MFGLPSFPSRKARSDSCEQEKSELLNHRLGYANGIQRKKEIHEYQDPAWEQKKLLNMKVLVLPIILGTIQKTLVQRIWKFEKKLRQ